MPSHALATIAVCEAAALSHGRDKQWQTLAQAMVDYIVATQDGDGGWSNKPVLAESIHAKIRRQREKPEPSTMLATGWTLMALRTARWADVDVPDRTFQRAVEFLAGMVAHGGPAGKYGEEDDRRGRLPRQCAGEAAELATLLGVWGGCGSPSSAGRAAARLGWRLCPLGRAGRRFTGTGRGTSPGHRLAANHPAGAIGASRCATI